MSYDELRINGTLFRYDYAQDDIVDIRRLPHWTPAFAETGDARTGVTRDDNR
jgi:hypothetical protein